MLNYAFVEFVTGKKRFVVDIKSIKDFNPKHHDDFNPEEQYEVQWPILRRENSETTEKPYLANIICLSATRESMIKRAASLNKKLPSGFLSEVKKSQSKATTAKDAKESTSNSRAASKQAMERLKTARLQASSRRMKQIIGGHKESSSQKSSPKKSSPKKSSSKKSSPNKSSPPTSGQYQHVSSGQGLDQDKDILCGTPKDLHGSQPESESSVNDFDVGFETHPTLPHQPSTEKLSSSPVSKDLSVKPRENPCTSNNSKDITPSLLPTHCSKDLMQNTNEQEDSPAEKKRQNPAQKRKQPTPPSSVSSDTDSYESSSTEIKRLTDQLHKVQKQLTSERKKRKILERKSVEIQASLKLWNDFVCDLRAKAETLPSILESEDNKNHASYAKHSSPLAMQPNSCSPSSTKWVETSFEYSGSFKISTPVKAATDRLSYKSSASCRSLFSESPAFKNSSPLKAYSPTGPDITQKIKPSHLNEETDKRSLNTVENLNDDQSFVCKKKKLIVKKSCSTADVSLLKKKARTEDSSNVLGPDQLPNKKLAPMILSALNGETNLQENGNGKVHIGNNVWIKKLVWTERFMKARKLSTMVKDLAEEIWGYKECAKMSVCGGVSPRSQGSSVKPAAPRHIVEAIYAVFRAKMMMQGTLHEAHLDTAVEELAKKYLMEKFNDCSKKLSREANVSEDNVLEA